MNATSKFKITFPETGTAPEEILAQMDRMRVKDLDWKGGRAWSLVYYIDEEHLQLLKNSHDAFFSESYLNPFAFKSVQRMEQEVVRMTADMLHGDEQTVGTMTTGGTESIFLPLYTYREIARRKNPRVKRPEIVVPDSIHPAFDKAAHILNIRLRKAKVGKNWAADPAAMEALINKNTIAIAASSPSYPHGAQDPVPAIGKIAQKHRLPFHVDGCLGGFMLPWVEALGYELLPWDFRVAGVTSMSADLHKFGYGEKGSSVLLYRNIDYMKHQIFITTEWSGGIYATPTMMGTRPCGPIAAGWAAIHRLGREGYMKVAKANMDAKEALEEALRAFPEIKVLGKPCMNILTYTTRSNKPDIFVVADYLESKGWAVDRTQKPNAIHLIILPQNVPVIRDYARDLREALDYARAHPEAAAKGNAALYGLMARIPMRGMVKANVRKIFEEMYAGKTTNGNGMEEEEGYDASISDSPKWMGWLNRVLGWLKK